MQILESDLVAFVDVDGTLIRPSTFPGDLSIYEPYTNVHKLRRPIAGNIELLKKWKSQGYTIVVWSHGGYKWALEVVKTLGLVQYVDLVQAKPNKYADDLPCTEWMGNRVFVEED